MIPIRFEYVERCTDIEHKRFVTVLGEHTQHYTNKKLIRIREEYEEGVVREHWVSEETMNQMLSKRVEVAE
jgi:hypothetical protein